MRYALVLVVMIILPVVPVGAQEFFWFGNIRLDTAWHHADDPVIDASLPWYGLSDWQTAAAAVEADMRLTMDKVQVRVHHDLTFDQESEFTYRLFEGYASLTPFPEMTVTLGKRRLGWGTGFFFFPADKINPVSLDPSSARRDQGFPGLAVTLTSGADFTLTAAVSFEESLKHDIDFFARDFRYGLACSLLLGQLNIKADVIYQTDQVFRPGAGFTLDLAGFIFFAETALELHNRTYYPSSPLVWERHDLFAPFVSVEAGVRRNISIGDAVLFFAAEYFFTDAGFTRDQEDLFFQAMGMGAGFPPEYLGRHYLVGSMSVEWERYFFTEHAVVWNVQDGSMLFTHRLALLVIENIDLFCEVTWTAGTTTTEFGAVGERLKIAAGAVCYF